MTVSTVLDQHTGETLRLARIRKWRERNPALLAAIREAASEAGRNDAPVTAAEMRELRNILSPDWSPSS